MERVAEVLEKAISLDGERRRQFLEQACAGDDALRREVESLIQAHEQAGSRFLNETPAFAAFGGPAGAAPPAAGQRVGAYLLQETIGHGGMGEVFAAVRADGQYEKRVALKLVRGGYDSAIVLERFLNERQILAGLDHPNIARLLDGGTTDAGVPYLVMELVEGMPIDAYCDARKLPLAERLQLFRQVCSAVQYAHQHLVIHRDIKPGNILVTADGTPKLLDFGIAKILDASGAAQATVLRPMTPEFASPEQVGGGAITTATDVYSLGVVLYRLLTGRSPYNADAGNSAQLALAIGTAEPERPSASGRAGLRGDVDSILLKALRKEPERRYSSVEQFSEDIRRHLEGLPVLARKGTWSYVAGKFLRRNAPAAAVAGLLLATLIGGVVVTMREARIAAVNERRAEARFGDVRKLANSLLFEINDSIKDIAGATQARQLILQRSLEYLDRLAAEAGSDPALLRELATAYSRVGELQGNPLGSNVGDTGAALASARKAIELREALIRSSANGRRDRLELASAYLDYAEMQMGAAGHMQAAFDYGGRALAILDREVSAAPDDPAVIEQAVRGHEMVGVMQVGVGAIGRVGSTVNGVADLQQALALNERLLRLNASDADARKQDGVISSLLADAVSKLGDRTRALALYRRALESLAAADPQGTRPATAANVAIVTSKVGDTLLIDGRPAEAIPYYRKAEQAARHLVAIDPHEEMYLTALMDNSTEFGVGLVASGRTAEGLTYLRKALDVAQSLAQTTVVRTIQGYIHLWIGIAHQHEGRLEQARHEYEAAKRVHAAVLQGGADDVRMQIYFAMATDRLAQALLGLGRIGEAGREYDESLAHLEALDGAYREDPEVLYALAEIYAGQGVLAMELAGRSSARDGGFARWRSAQQWLRRSLDTSSRIVNPTRISFSGFEVTAREDASRRLARCNRELEALAVAER